MQKLLRYVTPQDNINLIFEIILIVLVFYYITEEIIEISSAKYSYFIKFWNLFDCVVIFLIIGCIGISIYRYLVVDAELAKLEQNPNEYVSFEAVSHFETIYVDLSAISLFLSWLKIFKYISFNRTMRHFSTTLQRCSKDILSFAVMFFIVFFAFAQLGLLLFGTTLEDFSSFTDSTYTLFRIILGDFDFLALERASKILGPTFFIIYIFAVFFILLNMFLAIINDTYTGVKSEMDAEEEATLGIGTFLKTRAAGVLNFLKRKKTAKGDTAVVGKGEKKILKGYDATQQMLQEGGTKAITTIEHPTLEEFKILTRRVDRNDDAMGSVIAKVDAVLAKLEIVEKSITKGVFPLVDEASLKDDGLEEEQTIHIPDETDIGRHWT